VFQSVSSMGHTKTFILLVLVISIDACKRSSSPPSEPPQKVSTKSSEDIFECDDRDPGAGLKQFSSANTEFFLSLYKSLKSEGNVLLSPYSIFSGLSLLQLATVGQTRTQYQQVLHYGKENSSVIHQQARDVLQSLDRLSRVSNETFILRSANSIFLDSSLVVKQSYMSKAQCYYKAGVTTLPLQADPQRSAEKMNAWVSNKTNNRITDLVSAGSLGGNTMAVLVNTVFFKAPWRLPFNKFSTKADVLFTRQDTTKVRVDMMVLEKYLSFARLQSGGIIVELDYDTCKDCDEESSEMAMYVFIPDKEVDWEVFEQEVLQADILSGEGVKFDQESIRLEMPKFEVSHQVDLVDALSELGLNLGGDFSGLSESSTQVSDVLHRVFLRVDEEGSEGAAATALFMSRMLFIPRMSITVDTTFFISIVHKQSRVVVFAGKVDKPEKVNNE